MFISTCGAAKVEPEARKMSATLKTGERRANGLPIIFKIYYFKSKFLILRCIPDQFRDRQGETKYMTLEYRKIRK